MVVKLDLQYGAPKTWREGSLGYIPVSPEAIDSHAHTGWTIYDLEELAFNNIPFEFTDARMEVARRLEALGDNAILQTYGPVEGDYYVEIPKIQGAEGKP